MVHGTHNALGDERNKDIKIFINGELFARDEAKISVFDSGYQIGDGVWEALRLHDGVLVFLDKHLDRLWQGAATIGMDIGMSRQDIDSALWMTLNANGMTDNVHCRFMLTRGIKKTSSQDPRLIISGPNLVIIPEYKTVDSSSRQKGIKLFTSTVRRGSPDYLDPRLNCHSKLHEVTALVQAIQAGADEALMLDVHGFVSTCNATNFFLVKKGEVWTSTGQYCMNGITRGAIIDICHAHGIPCYERDFSLFDVYGADEAFVTGTFGGVTPVIEVDGRLIGACASTELSTDSMGLMSKRLQHLYEDEIRREIVRVKSVGTA